MLFCSTMRSRVVSSWMRGGRMPASYARSFTSVREG
jgi:hypothetical protein